MDRLAHGRIDDEARSVLVTALGRRLADLMQDNLLDIAGPGEYRAPFVEMLNERLDDYARFEFDAAEPGFEALRYFGDRVMRAMGGQPDQPLGDGPRHGDLGAGAVREGLDEREQPARIDGMRRGLSPHHQSR